MTRAVWLLGLGAVAGVSLAAWDVATPALWHGRGSFEDSSAVPTDAVAVVNGHPLSKASYERALAAVASTKRDGVLEEWEKRQILDRLIDEELLVEAAFSIDSITRDPQVRAVLSRAVIDHVRSLQDTPEISPEELDRFYRANEARFRIAPRLQIEEAFFAVEGEEGDERRPEGAVREAAEAGVAEREGMGNEARRSDSDAAAKARAEAAREAFMRDPSRPLSSYGDAPVLRLPSGPVAVDVLQNYLGPTVARAALQLDDGAVSSPTRSATGYHVLRLVRLVPERTPPLDEIRDQVKGLYSKERDEQLIRGYLAGRRRTSAISISGDPP